MKVHRALHRNEHLVVDAVEYLLDEIGHRTTVGA